MINYVTLAQMESVWEGIDTRRETFIAKCIDGPYLACDNTTGESLVERFQTLFGAIKWCTFSHLNADDVRRDERIHRAFNRPLEINI